jgi:adenylate cyclase
MNLRYTRFFISCFALVGALLAQTLFPSVFAPLNFALKDGQTRLAWEFSKPKDASRERRVIIVDIDERSLQEQGAWPWSREKLSDLISKLIDHHGATAVALDIVFPEAKENDAQLLQQLQRPEVTGAVVYDFLNRAQPDISAQLPKPPNMTLQAHMPRTSGIPVTSNHAALMPPRIGHITPLFDQDGSIRNLPPVACHPKRISECRPILGIAAFMGLIDGAELEIKVGQGWFAPAWEMWVQDASKNPIVRLPLNVDGTLTVPYRHQVSDWFVMSATDVLNGKFSRELTQGSLVLVGATALGMSDVVITPVSPVASGIEPHAEVMVALLDQNFLVTPHDGALFVAVFLLLVGSLFVLGMRHVKRPLYKAIFIPCALSLMWLASAALAMWTYVAHALLLPLVPLALFPLLLVLSLVLYEYYVSASDHLGVFGILAAYLPKPVAEKLSLNRARGVDTKVDASRREITVLFADVRGFTGIVENYKPEIVAKLMHQVFSEMAAAIAGQHGTIDKFIGDAVMAFWNAPNVDEQHAEHALAAAQDMLERMENLHAFCEELGVPDIKIGIGIETGYALVGNFGSEHRRTYTALGEPVVLASRIEGMTARLNESILIGARCAELLEFKDLRALGEMPVRGRQRSIALYAPSSSQI